MRVTLETNGSETYIIIPRDFLDRHGLKVGDSIELDAFVRPVIEPQKPVFLSAEEEADFEEELKAARICMEKYKTALKRLADS